jgi:hypothetical protein
MGGCREHEIGHTIVREVGSGKYMPKASLPTFEVIVMPHRTVGRADGRSVVGGRGPKTPISDLKPGGVDRRADAENLAKLSQRRSTEYLTSSTAASTDGRHVSNATVADSTASRRSEVAATWSAAVSNCWMEDVCRATTDSSAAHRESCAERRSEMSRKILDCSSITNLRFGSMAPECLARRV